MEQNIQMRQCEIDTEHRILDLEVEGEIPCAVQGDRFRIAAVFNDGQVDRYFPMIAYVTMCREDGTSFHAAAKIRLDTVFFEYHPGNPDDIILLKFCTCTPEYEWLTFETDVTLKAALFQSAAVSGMGIRKRLHQAFRVIKYLICTLLLPIWLLSGYLAWKGYGSFHPAARGRQGKRAVFYHAHGLVMDWTGYGYSIREYKTNYFKRNYQKTCKRIPETDGILFLSERKAEPGGNLDLVRRVLKKRYEQGDAVFQGELREFLVNRPVQKLSWKELRCLANKVAASRVIILEDFYPQLHALPIRPQTKILQLWHACGAFKLFGLSDLGISEHLEQDTRNHRSYDVAIASGAGVIPFYSEAFGIPSSHIAPVGVPRTDFFFQEEAVRQKIQELYQRYPVLQGKRVLLFAPTFRGSGNQTAYYPVERFPVHRILEAVPDDVVLIIKNHPFVQNRIETAEADQNRVLDLTGEENINDLLLITDVLVTDYSSVIFEAAILQIPMLFYVFDLDEYIQSRDLYFDFASFVPGQIVRDLPDLIQAVSETLQSPENYVPAVSFQEFFLGAVDGHSTERVVMLAEQLYRGNTDLRQVTDQGETGDPQDPLSGGGDNDKNGQGGNGMYQKWKTELERFSQGSSEYEWDELEELITDDFEEEKLTVEEFDGLMEQLMDIDA